MARKAKLVYQLRKYSVPIAIENIPLNIILLEHGSLSFFFLFFQLLKQLNGLDVLFVDIMQSQLERVGYIHAQHVALIFLPCIRHLLSVRIVVIKLGISNTDIK